MKCSYMLCLDRRALKGKFGAEVMELLKLNFFLLLIIPPLICCYLKRHHCEIASILKWQTHIKCVRMCRM